MGVVQLPDELQRVIERQVAEGRAVSAAAFVEQAVRRLVEEAKGEEDEIAQVIESGSADIDAAYREAAPRRQSPSSHRVSLGIGRGRVVGLVHDRMVLSRAARNLLREIDQ